MEADCEAEAAWESDADSEGNTEADCESDADSEGESAADCDSDPGSEDDSEIVSDCVTDAASEVNSEDDVSEAGVVADWGLRLGLASPQDPSIPARHRSKRSFLYVLISISYS